MNNLDEEKFVQAICSSLDASIAHLDSNVTTRLEHMRQSALAGHAGRSAQAENTALVQHIRSSLDASPEISPAIQSRLDAARRQALANLQQRRSNPVLAAGERLRDVITSLRDFSLLARPANMLATACVMVTLVSLFYASSRPAGTLPIEEEIMLIASAEDFELVENLDFYLWLAENGLPN